MKQIIGIKEQKFEDFIKKINECYINKKAFATQVFNDAKNFYALVYFDSEDSKKNEIISQEDKPTEKQIAYLKKMGIKELPKTKQEATIMIRDIIENNK